MFQNFKVSARPEQSAPRVSALRDAMVADDIAGFIVPRADAHQGEDVAACDERLAWLTGFTGSAGYAVILADTAAVFADGRYKVQARAQVDPALFKVVDWPQTSVGAWLDTHASGRIGFDPWLFTRDQIASFRKACGTAVEIVATDDLVARVWTDRPEPPNAKAVVQPLEFVGKTSAEKIELVTGILSDKGAEAVVLTLPDSISWLLNIRGSDIARNPVVQTFAIVTVDGHVSLFADPSKFSDIDLDPAPAIAPRDAFPAALATLEGTVLVDPASAPYAVFDFLERAEIVEAQDPCILPKASKTDAEIRGTREAHLRDGAAMVEFLAWLDAQNPASLTEIDVVTALEGFRRGTNMLRDISFDTICGAGPHGAIVHYRVTEDTNRALASGELLLVDSGGQYVDGTTDITRTVALGTPPADAIGPFTRVLQGMIGISTARFPKGVTGAHLDALARAPLWRAGLDYDHGTGHGVGAYLSVHEGPQRISRMSDVPLEPGMILSNEPGYYREGAWGIRTENLIVVQDAPPIDGGDPREMHDFETLTFVPIDKRLVDPTALAPWEHMWLDAYHAEVFEKIAPRVSEAARDWLRQATAPLR